MRSINSYGKETKKMYIGKVILLVLVWAPAKHSLMFSYHYKRKNHVKLRNSYQKINPFNSMVIKKNLNY